MKDYSPQESYRLLDDAIRQLTEKFLADANEDAQQWEIIHHLYLLRDQQPVASVGFNTCQKIENADKMTSTAICLAIAAKDTTGNIEASGDTLNAYNADKSEYIVYEVAKVSGDYVELKTL